MDTVIDQVHRRASILGPLLWGSSLPTTGNEGYEGIEYFFLLLWGKEIFFLLLWGKNWKGSNDLTAPLWSCMLYLWPQVRSFYSWSLGGISLGGWKKSLPAAAREIFFGVIIHMVKNYCWQRPPNFFWIILNMEKYHCWRQPAKLFRVLSSYGKKIITGGSRQKNFRGIFHMVTKLLLAAADKNF